MYTRYLTRDVFLFRWKYMQPNASLKSLLKHLFQVFSRPWWTSRAGQKSPRTRRAAWPGPWSTASSSSMSTEEPVQRASSALWVRPSCDWAWSVSCYSSANKFRSNTVCPTFTIWAANTSWPPQSLLDSIVNTCGCAHTRVFSTDTCLFLTSTDGLRWRKTVKILCDRIRRSERMPLPKFRAKSKKVNTKQPQLWNQTCNRHYFENLGIF